MKDDTCVCCGREIPEGRQVCPDCEARAAKYDPAEFFSAERKRKPVRVRDPEMDRLLEEAGFE